MKKHDGAIAEETSTKNGGNFPEGTAGTAVRRRNGEHLDPVLPLLLCGRCGNNCGLGAFLAAVLLRISPELRRNRQRTVLCGRSARQLFSQHVLGIPQLEDQIPSGGVHGIRCHWRGGTAADHRHYQAV